MISADVLLDWYDSHARVLPWRVSPCDLRAGISPDPYRVWLSEIMLQQTTVATVKDYFAKFTSLWPTLAALANASEDDILKAWAGLGYYSRARNLKKCADILVADHGGQFPQTIEGLKTLPGIGDYTAAAIGSIAFGLPAPVVDGNIERVMTRCFAIETALPAAKPLIKAEVAAILPVDRPGDFAQAMMDLGATIYTPRKPACMHCPWRSGCKALSGDPERFPRKAAKREKPKRKGAAFVIVNAKGAVLLEKRGASGLLAGMTQVPTTDWTSRQDGATDKHAAPLEATWTNVGTISHVFTHFELELTVWHTTTDAVIRTGQWWSSLEQIGGEALPTVMKKAIGCALPDVFKRDIQ